MLNLLLTVGWAIMLPVSIVTGLWQSVAFISVVSIYANFVSHLAAWRADVPIEPDPTTQRLFNELEKFLAHREETDIKPEDVGDTNGEVESERSCCPSDHSCGLSFVSDAGDASGS